ncbi:hypothetical protein [Streptomyces lasiicapitis]|uniref:hypothetical protein n=1 Tax=Streptomyces lasiicapitis TaxID=1923961 RepID=UPI00368F027D
MSRSQEVTPQQLRAPAFELRCGGMHLTIQRVPVWLVSLITTAGSVGATWWAHQ